MDIGVYYPKKLSFSARNYIHSIVNQAESDNHHFHFVRDLTSQPHQFDLLWDPRSMGGKSPCPEFCKSSVPLVVTVHGAAPYAVKHEEYFSSALSYAKWSVYRRLHEFRWSRYRDRCDRFITVSNYAKSEIVEYLKLPAQKVEPIWHGVDADTFKADCTQESPRRYFLHISQHQPKKNFARILEAYRKIELDEKPELVAVIPGASPPQESIEGVRIISNPLNGVELSKLYQSAIAFVCCSLHETFGLTILEAMASGCPVITANTTACPEIAGDAALLVNPRSTDEICQAMTRIAMDQTLQQDLVNRGLERATHFTWARSAQQHLDIFRDTKASSGQPSPGA